MSEAAFMLRCRSFSVPKKGNSRTEYEDAASFDCVAGRFAIADGATESIFAGEWASLLCRSFVHELADPEAVNDWRTSLQRRWLEQIYRDTLPWYVSEKLEEGAFATFIGVSIASGEPDRPRPWKSWAVGDSCLFQIRKSVLLKAFPLERHDEFGTRPLLISSRQRSSAAPLTAQGELEQGDTILMMTDALAEWFLHEYEAGRGPWDELMPLRDGDFVNWIDNLRVRGQMKNDDVTLLVVEITPA